MNRIAGSYIDQLHAKVPPGWVQGVSIEELVLAFDTTQPKKTPNRLFKYIDIGAIDNSTNTVVSCKEFSGENAPSRARRVIKHGDVLFSTVRTYLKKIALVPEEFDMELTSTGIAILRANSATTNKFLFYSVLRDSFISAISGEMDGTLYPAINDRDLYKAQIQVPPLNEQRRIVAKIEALTARSRRAKEALDAIPPLLERFRQSVLAAAFRGDLTKEWRAQNPNVEPASILLERIKKERRKRWEEAQLEKMRAKGKPPKDDKWKAKYKEPKPVDTEGLPELPEGWCWASVDEIAECALGKMLDKSKHTKGKKLFYMRNQNVRWDDLDVSEVFEMYFQDEEIQRFQLRKNDILICEGGEPGRAAVWDGRIDSMMYQKALHRARPYGNINPRWIVYHLWKDASIGLLEKHFTGTTIKHFTGRTLARYPIAIAPQVEQKEVMQQLMNIFGSLPKIEELQNRMIQQVLCLNQSILAKAFRGELVPQDPNDEPASVLLERIRAERAAAEAKKPKKKSKASKARTKKAKA